MTGTTLSTPATLTAEHERRRTDSGDRAGHWRGIDVVSVGPCRTDGAPSVGCAAARRGSYDAQYGDRTASTRRQKKYESPQSTPVAAAQPHASGPSPTERWAMSAEPRVMAKPA